MMISAVLISALGSEKPGVESVQLETSDGKVLGRTVFFTKMRSAVDLRRLSPERMVGGS